MLADLRLDARPDNGALVVASSARRVAANMGIGKDTAARALRRLAAAQVLRRRPQGSDDDGRFSRGGYELHLDQWQLPPSPAETDAAGGSRTRIADTVRRAPGPGMVAGRPSQRRRDGRDPAYGDQLCLLPMTANAGEAGTKARS